MRACAILVLLLGACSFQPSHGVPPGPDATGGGGGGGGGGPTLDAAGGSDAGSGSATIDAACPDSDHDGTCDAQDAWPCGQQPSGPSGTVNVFGNNTFWSASHVKVADGSNLYVATANQPFSLSFDYYISRDCSNGQDCPLQLQYGTDAGGAAGCVWAGEVSGHFVPVVGSIGDRQASWDGSVTLTSSGVYELRLDASQESECPMAWGGGAPDGQATIAIVCVP